MIFHSFNPSLHAENFSSHLIDRLRDNILVHEKRERTRKVDADKRSLPLDNEIRRVRGGYETERERDK